MSKVMGRGINDADYEVSWEENGKRAYCPIYRRWLGILSRCYGRTVLIKNPRYYKCKVSKDWLKFSNFRRWVITQNWEGNFLDKDILVKGNKVYSAETCVFVSPKVNSFIRNFSENIGEYPLGVYRRSDSKNVRFRARCSNPFTGKHEFLGDFKCPDEAHLTWKKRKLELAEQLADLEPNSRVAEAIRNFYK